MLHIASMYAIIAALNKRKYMSKIISTYYKETADGPRAEVVQDGITYSIEYYNGRDVAPFAREEFPHNSIHFVQDAAENWAMDIKTLNG